MCCGTHTAVTEVGAAKQPTSRAFTSRLPQAHRGTLTVADHVKCCSRTATSVRAAALALLAVALCWLEQMLHCFFAAAFTRSCTNCVTRSRSADCSEEAAPE